MGSRDDARAARARRIARDALLADLRRAGVSIEEAAALLVGHWLACPDAFDLPVLTAAANHLAAAVRRPPRRVLEASTLFRVLRAADLDRRYRRAAAAWRCGRDAAGDDALVRQVAEAFRASLEGVA